MPTVLGVLSRGSTDGDASTCSAAIYTRMDAFRSFIVAAVTTAAADGAYTVPSWTIAVPDDGVYPDAGATPDAATSGSDSGTSGGPPGLGGACTPATGCAVGTCENNGTTTVCATSCELDGGGCPEGFSCNTGLCFVGEGTSTGNPDRGSVLRLQRRRQQPRRRPAGSLGHERPHRCLGVSLLTRRRRKNASRHS